MKYPENYKKRAFFSTHYSDSIFELNYLVGDNDYQVVYDFEGNVIKGLTID